MGVLRIGELAARTGVTTDTIRFYERTGLLPPPPRSESGYRQYAEGAVQRIQVIRSALGFGFSVKAVAGFLHLRDAGAAPCSQVRAAAQGLLNEMDKTIDEKIATRDAMRDILQQWDAQLDKTPAGQPARLLELLPPNPNRRVGRAGRPPVTRRSPARAE